MSKHTNTDDNKDNDCDNYDGCDNYDDYNEYDDAFGIDPSSGLFPTESNLKSIEPFVYEEWLKKEEGLELKRNDCDISNPRRFACDYQDEKKLIKELNLSRDLSSLFDIDIDKTDQSLSAVENELKGCNNYVDEDLVLKKLFTDAEIITLNFDSEIDDTNTNMPDTSNMIISTKGYPCGLTQVISVELKENCNVFGNPYLIISDKISDLDIGALTKLLNLEISLAIGSVHVSSFSVATNILLAYLCDKHVLEGDIKMTKIPLMIFHNNNGDCVSKLALKYHDISVSIRTNDFDLNRIVKNFDIKLEVTKYYYECDDNNDNEIKQSTKINENRMFDQRLPTVDQRLPTVEAIDTICISSENNVYSFTNNIYMINLPSLTRFIVFRFIRQTEHIHLQPNIINVSLFKKDVMFAEFDNVMTVNLYSIDTNFFIVSLYDSPDMHDIKDIIKSCNIRNCFCDLKNNFCTFGSIEIKIMTDILCDNYDIVITPISFNIARYLSGMMGLLYDSDTYINDNDQSC
jgi:hypothetical protein